MRVSFILFYALKFFSPRGFARTKDVGSWEYFYLTIKTSGRNDQEFAGHLLGWNSGTTFSAEAFYMSRPGKIEGRYFVFASEPNELSCG